MNKQAGFAVVRCRFVGGPAHNETRLVKLDGRPAIIWGPAAATDAPGVLAACTLYYPVGISTAGGAVGLEYHAHGDGALIGSGGDGTSRDPLGDPRRMGVDRVVRRARIHFAAKLAKYRHGPRRAEPVRP